MNSKFSIPKSEYAQRVRIVREQLRDAGFDGLLAISGYAERDGNVTYLCGHKNAFPYSARSETISGLGYSAFLLPVDAETTLIAPLGYQTDAVTGVDRTQTGTNLTKGIITALTESRLDHARLAIAGSDILPAVYLDEIRRSCPQTSVHYRDELISERRMIKSENELQIIRHASKIADKALQTALEAIKPGMTESDVGSIARMKAMEIGADYVVRDRVQSGPEMGRLRWPFASQKKIRKGELISIDFVGWVNGYGFDILRVGSANRPTKQQRTIIEAAGEATSTMCDTLRNGSTVENTISTVNKLERRGLKVAPFGHAIGLEIVETPYLLPGGTGIVQKNMVFCVEPDVKSGKYSVSVENEVIVTNSKPEI
ncbi:MAG TPA: Xaa-Pro peptidase family protein, partial [Candidatus Acidoferrum sp.]|nr:Xaa-Pro peptidase family protein [Candidatus Acidoferrum sp.]